MGVGTYAAIVLFVLLAVNVVIALWGIGLVYPHMDSEISLYVITPFIIELISFSGLPFFLYYLFLAAAITLSFIWAIGKSARPLADETRLRYPSSGHSPLYMIGTMFMAVLSFNIIYYFIIMGSGANPAVPTSDSAQLWELIYSFARASVWEEVVSRVLMIGIPLLIIGYAVSRPGAEGRGRKWYNYILGGGFKIGRVEAFFLAFSSAMFGLAHVFAWDPYKILPAAVAGLAFGYLFLKVGLYASIMLHFAFDFLSMPLALFPGVTLDVVLGLAIIAWIVIGVPYMLLYASKGLGWFLGYKVWPEKPMASSKPSYAAAYGPYPSYYPPSPYQPSIPYHYPAAPTPSQAPAQAPPPANYGRPPSPTAIGFTCRNCGNREAQYKDGMLTCTRCGYKN
jgi:hypothetical protein